MVMFNFVNEFPEIRLFPVQFIELSVSIHGVKLALAGLQMIPLSFLMPLETLTGRSCIFLFFLFLI